MQANKTGLSPENLAFLDAMQQAAGAGLLDGNDRQLLEMIQAELSGPTAPSKPTAPNRSRDIEQRKQAAFQTVGPIGGLATLLPNLADRARAVGDSSFRDAEGEVNYFNNPVGQTLWQGLQAAGDFTSSFTGDLLRGGAVKAGAEPGGLVSEGAGLAGDLLGPGGANKVIRGGLRVAERVGITAAGSAEKTTQRLANAIPSVLSKLMPAKAERWYGKEAEQVISKYIPINADPTGLVVGRAALDDMNETYQGLLRVRNDNYDRVGQLLSGRETVSTEPILKEAKEILRASGASIDGGGVASTAAQRVIAQLSSAKGAERIPGLVDQYKNPMWGVIDAVADKSTAPLADILESIKTIGRQADKATNPRDKTFALNLKSAMEQSVSDLLRARPELQPAFNAMETAKSFSRDVFYPLYGMKSTGRKMLKTDASQIVDDLFFKTKTPEQIGLVKQAIRSAANGEETWRALGESAFSRMFSAAKPRGKDFNPAEFARQWDRIAEPTKRSMFDNFDEVDRVVSKMAKLTEGQKGSSGLAMSSKLALGGGVYGALAHGNVIGLIYSAAASLGGAVFSKFMNSPQAVRLLDQGADIKRGMSAGHLAQKLNMLLHDTVSAVDRDRFEQEQQAMDDRIKRGQ